MAEKGRACPPTYNLKARLEELEAKCGKALLELDSPEILRLLHQEHADRAETAATATATATATPVRSPLPAAAAAAAAAAAPIPVFEWKMWIVINSDLKKMGGGKIGAQSAHAACAWERELAVKSRASDVRVREDKQTAAYKAWVAHQEPKIVLGAKQDEMLAMLAKYPELTRAIHDAGKTQIPAGSLTAIAFCPMRVDQQPPELKALKCL
jgi:peptidyl-tRNA hydrolase